MTEVHRKFANLGAMTIVAAGIMFLWRYVAQAEGMPDIGLIVGYLVGVAMGMIVMDLIAQMRTDSQEYAADPASRQGMASGPARRNRGI